ncbi:pentapeptide repeat-containing protein [Actinoplanes ianthinogenes]|uniref:pentapeptide repeat-containing protein n=1 Tax=Actinoplanes ianthinogenes TaxID=122358 RepID=UPI0034D6D74D
MSQFRSLRRRLSRLSRRTTSSPDGSPTRLRLHLRRSLSVCEVRRRLRVPVLLRLDHRSPSDRPNRTGLPSRRPLSRRLPPGHPGRREFRTGRRFVRRSRLHRRSPDVPTGARIRNGRHPPSPAGRHLAGADRDLCRRRFRPLRPEPAHRRGSRLRRPAGRHLGLRRPNRRRLGPAPAGLTLRGRPGRGSRPLPHRRTPDDPPVLDLDDAFVRREEQLPPSPSALRERRHLRRSQILARRLFVLGRLQSFQIGPIRTPLVGFPSGVRRIPRRREPPTEERPIRQLTRRDLVVLRPRPGRGGLRPGRRRPPVPVLVAGIRRHRHLSLVRKVTAGRRDAPTAPDRCRAPRFPLRHNPFTYALSPRHRHPHLPGAPPRPTGPTSDGSTGPTRARLGRTSLSHAALSRTSLAHAHLGRPGLGRTRLGHTSVSRAALSRTSLSHAHLGHTSVSRAALSRASLGPAHLGRTSLSRTSLSRARLGRTSLSRATLSRTGLGRTSPSRNRLGRTCLGRCSVCRTGFCRPHRARARRADGTALGTVRHGGLGRRGLAGAATPGRPFRRSRGRRAGPAHPAGHRPSRTTLGHGPSRRHRLDRRLPGRTGRLGDRLVRTRALNHRLA